MQNKTTDRVVIQESNYTAIENSVKYELETVNSINTAFWQWSIATDLLQKGYIVSFRRKSPERRSKQVRVSMSCEFDRETEGNRATRG